MPELRLHCGTARNIKCAVCDGHLMELATYFIEPGAHVTMVVKCMRHRCGKKNLISANQKRTIVCEYRI